MSFETVQHLSMIQYSFHHQFSHLFQEQPIVAGNKYALATERGDKRFLYGAYILSSFWACTTLFPQMRHTVPMDIQMSRSFTLSQK